VKRLIASGALAAAVALSLASSGGGTDVREGGTFRVGIFAQNIDSIDAALTGIAGTITLMRATCAGLMRTPDKPLPEGLRLIPDLAADYPTITDGGKTYTYRIKKGLRFSTGARVTARDVAHTINRILNPAMKAYAARYFSDIVGARAVLEGRAETASGVRARADSLTIRLTKPLGDFTARVAVGACVVPSTVRVDPEGAKAPIPSAGPYYFANHIANRQIVLERNRFYRGSRPHHIDRFVVDLTRDPAALLDAVDRGKLDYAWLTTSDFANRANEFRRKYGMNRSRFFAVPASFLRMFVLNTSRPLLRNNVALRQAINFAVDRKALLRERGPLGGFLTDQYLPPGMPGFRDARVYPLEKPDLKRARGLAKGNLRGGKAVLYTIDNPLGIAQAQIVKRDLKRMGLDVEITQLPGTLFFDKLATKGEAFDIAWSGWLADLPDPSLLNDLFEGRNIPDPNHSRFASPNYNRMLSRAARLTGAARYREYGRLDVDLARNAAPAIAYAYDNVLTLVSRRTGCVVVNPYLDLAAVCLK
jgi:peptide/nickel transport system substrate-binding protein